MIYAIIVGMIAGWLAGQVMRGGGYGVLMDLVLGLLGGIVGGWVFGSLGVWPSGGILGSVIVSFIGAVILVALTRVCERAGGGCRRMMCPTSAARGRVSRAPAAPVRFAPASLAQVSLEPAAW